MSDMDRQKTRMTKKFEKLHTRDPPNGASQTSGLQVEGADPPLGTIPLFADSVLGLWQGLVVGRQLVPAVVQ